MELMPKLEHVKLVFSVHKRECLNGASDLGIQHLSSLRRVEVILVATAMTTATTIQQKIRMMALSHGLQPLLMVPSRHIRTVPVSDLKHGTIRSVNCSKV